MQIFSMQDESPRAQATTKGINPDKPDRSQDLRQGKRIYWLDTARFIAIIAITSTHALHRAFLGPAEGISAGENIFRGIIQPFCRLGVPLFLMISGALLLNRRMENDSDISRFYRHNLLSVFITSEIWFFIMFWFRTLGHANDFLSHGMAYTIGRLAGTMLFVNQESMDSMWYMPMILCIYMLIPWVNLAVHKVKVKYIALPALIVIISSMIIPNINELIRITGGKRISILPFRRVIFFQCTWYSLSWVTISGTGCFHISRPWLFLSSAPAALSSSASIRQCDIRSILPVI